MTRFDDENIRAMRGMSLVGRVMPEDSKTRATSEGSSGRLWWYSIITNGARKRDTHSSRHLRPRMAAVAGARRRPAHPQCGSRRRRVRAERGLRRRAARLGRELGGAAYEIGALSLAAARGRF